MAEKWWRLFTAFIIGAPWGTYTAYRPHPFMQIKEARRKRVQISGDFRRSDYSGNDSSSSSGNLAVRWLRGESWDGCSRDFRCKKNRKLNPLSLISNGGNFFSMREKERKNWKFNLWNFVYFACMDIVVIEKSERLHFSIHILIFR